MKLKNIFFLIPLIFFTPAFSRYRFMSKPFSFKTASAAVWNSGSPKRMNQIFNRVDFTDDELSALYNQAHVIYEKRAMRDGYLLENSPKITYTDFFKAIGTVGITFVGCVGTLLSYPLFAMQFFGVNVPVAIKWAMPVSMTLFTAGAYNWQVASKKAKERKKYIKLINSEKIAALVDEYCQPQVLITYESENEDFTLEPV